MATKWEITRFGSGFEDRHPLGRTQVLSKLRRRLRNLDLPITIEGDAKGTRFNLEGAMIFARRHLDGLKPGERLVFEGASYDQPKWTIRAVEVMPVAPLIHWGQQWVGRSSYLLGADGPPGQSDCSGFTASCVQAVYGITLPHGAELQQSDPRIRIFRDTGDVRRDDFIFYNYGRLNWPDADHVELIDQPGKRCLGSRPSTNGVGWYNLASWDADNILCYGRLRV